MSKLTLKEAEKRVSDIKIKNFKIMWAHANWQWKLIIILGIIYLVKILVLAGSYLGGLIR